LPFSSLDKLIDSIEFLSDDLKAGRDVKMSQSEVLKKSGEIFALRHVVNLSSGEFINTVDFFKKNFVIKKCLSLLL